MLEAFGDICFLSKLKITLNFITLFEYSRVYLVIMAALWNRAGHYIFSLWFLSSFFFYSSPNLSGHRFDVYHTSAHGVALVRS